VTNLRIVYIQTEGSLQATFERARLTCNTCFERAFNKSLTNATNAARGLAPVYDPFRWAGSHWALMPHHQPPHGILKASIGSWPIKSHMGGRLFTGDMHAMAKWSNWLEAGFRHRMARRRVRGRYFMKRAMTFSFEPNLERYIGEALIETFGGKP
jgi:hypothetical protein